MAQTNDAPAHLHSSVSLPPRSRRRIARRVAFIAVVLIVPALAIFYYSRQSAYDDLQAAIAEVDRLDPGWRLEELLARRPAVTPGKNSATVVSAARKRVAGLNFNVLDNLDKVPPPLLIRAEVEKDLRDELKPLGAALAEARKLAKLPVGHFTVAYTPEFINTLTPQIEDVREVARLLEMDVCLRVQSGDLHGAWVSAQAMLNAGRAVGDEPMFLFQMARLSVQRVTVAKLERILGQGEVPAALLAEMRKALEEEAAEPLFLFGIRGERAGSHRVLEGTANGTLPFNGKISGWKGLLPGFVDKPMIFRSHAWILRGLSRAAEDSKLPVMEQQRASKELEELAKNEAPALAKLLFPAVLRIAEAERREDTRLACAAAALAAEEFRLTHRRWPGTLEDLVKAGLLKSVPIDPYDGKALRSRQAPDGLVIYSIGAGGDYRGQALDNLAAIDSTFQRVEFRLWNVDRRRQPPQGVP
jgi:hypothetical protein